MAQKYRVEVRLSGQAVVRGRFDSVEEAKALQQELWKQGWYYVPVFQGDTFELATLS